MKYYVYDEMECDFDIRRVVVEFWECRGADESGGGEHGFGTEQVGTGGGIG